jgi:SMC interacting uncharacterized protein involved in chromosome segregation
MEPLETYYEIEYNTLVESRYWRGIGEKYKTFTEASNKVESLQKEIKSGLIKSLRIIKTNIYIEKETIKTFSI